MRADKKFTRKWRNPREKCEFRGDGIFGTLFAILLWRASNARRDSLGLLFAAQTFARRHWNGRPGMEPDHACVAGKAPPPSGRPFQPFYASGFSMVPLLVRSLSRCARHARDPLSPHAASGRTSTSSVESCQSAGALNVH